MLFREYIDEAKKKQGCKSFNELAKLMGMTSGGLSHLYNGGTGSEATIFKIARMSGHPFHEVMLAYQEEHAKTEEARTMWQKLRNAAASIFPVIATLPLLVNESVHCILC